MTTPHAFTPEGVKEARGEGRPLFGDFLKSREPFETLLREHPWLLPPNPKAPLDLEGDHYSVSYTHLTLPTKRIV